MITSLKTILKGNPMRIVFPEGTDPRVLKAARKLTDSGIVSSVTVLGDLSQILIAAWEINYNLQGITVENPKNHSLLGAYAADLLAVAGKKIYSLEQAKIQVTDPLYWGAMKLRNNEVDAMVAGAACSTAKVLRAVFSCIGTRPDIRNASSFIIIHVPDEHIGFNGHLLFSDCATIPDPTAEQLADITLSSVESFKFFFKAEPLVALLSFSTSGSGSHQTVDKVREALELIKNRDPYLKIDGEMQFDAAVIPSVAQAKAPDSPVAGRANILIFPDLNSANIGYKIAQRLGHADVYGPCLQGIARPVSDLSRGCSCDDIVNTSILTLAQVQKNKVPVMKHHSTLLNWGWKL